MNLLTLVQHSAAMRAGISGVSARTEHESHSEIQIQMPAYHIGISCSSLNSVEIAFSGFIAKIIASIEAEETCTGAEEPS